MRPDNWQRAIDIRFVSTVNKIPGVLLITRGVRRAAASSRRAYRGESVRRRIGTLMLNLLIVNARCLFRGETVFTEEEFNRNKSHTCFTGRCFFFAKRAKRLARAEVV